jgi:hypothetical protein
MIDRLSALADIVPPRPFLPPPAAPWWQGPWSVLLVTAMLVAAVGATWVIGRSRKPLRGLCALRRIRAQAMACASAADASCLASAAMACCAAAGVPSAALPATVRAMADTLRFDPGADPGALPELLHALRTALRWQIWRGMAGARAGSEGSAPPPKHEAGR